MNMRNAYGRRARQAGFTLIEALVALVVMAFGMFAIAGFQITMSRNSEVAKQRSEAVRLGQLKIEELRSFQTVTSDGVGGNFDYVSDVVAGSCVVPTTCTGMSAYTTNTQYALTWTLTKSDGTTTAAGTDLEKWINVTVTWADRTSIAANQTVTLRSVISRADPVDLGTLFTGPGSIKTRTPKNRNINIPYPAVELADGKSAFQPPGSSYSYVFDNATGEVLGYCGGSLAPGATVDVDDSDGSVTAGCVAEKATLLSGYVHFLSSIPGGTEKNVDNGVTNPNEDTREMTVGIDFVTNPSVGPSCFPQRQKVVRFGNIPDPRNIQSATRSGGTVTIQTQGNHGFGVGEVVSINGVTGGAFDGVFTINTKTSNSFTYADSRANASSSGGLVALVQELTIPETNADGTPFPVPPGYNTVISRFVAYTCIVRPVDDSDPNTTNVWSGQFIITPQPTATVAWALGTAAGSFKVCRFTGDYKTDNLMSNSEHPLIYRGVSGALDNQNYLVVPFNLACPTDTQPDPVTTDDYLNTHTVLHQTTTTGPRPYGGALSQGTQWGGSSSGEQSSDTTLPML